MIETPIRIGVVGTDNSHAAQIIRLFNIDRRLPHGSVVAVCGEPQAAGELAAQGGIDRVVAEPEGLLGLVDAAIVTDRHGALHAVHALPLIRAGLPVWVDKPFATSTADAERMLAAASEAAAPLTSYSVLRWTPEIVSLRALAEQSPLETLTVRGTADTESPYGGVFFYGIHLAEIACHLAPGPVQVQAVTRSADAVRVDALLGDTRVAIELLTPAGEQPVPFQVAAGRAGRTESVTVALGADYLLPAIDRFLQMVIPRTPPLPALELLRPVALLEQVERRLATLRRNHDEARGRHG